MSRCSRRTGLGVAFAMSWSLSTVAVSQARTWHVHPDGSGDAATVQAGIDAAVAGDDVLLAAGAYTWTSQGASGQSMLRMKRDVVLHSVSGAASTILDAEQQGRVIECVDVGMARIEGLTITGGRIFGGGFATGGGISSTGDSQPTISNCVVRGNNVNSDGAVGGGIYCLGGRVVDCEVLDNRVDGNNGAGGGIVCSNTIVSTCLIRGNRSRGGDGYSRGGGVVASASQLVDCRIESNVNEGSFFGGSGGGISLDGGTLLRCAVVGNRLQGQRSTYGGGVECTNATIADCLFLGNYVIGYGFPTAFWGGGAIAGLRGAPTNISGCTIVGNVAEQGFAMGIAPVGGVALEAGGTVSRTIIAGNTGSACTGAAVFECTNAFDNSGGDVICGMDGGGNFSADPQFCAQDPVASGNVALQTDSPCAPGNHPNGAACGLIGAAGVACGSVSVETRSWSDVKSSYRP